MGQKPLGDRVTTLEVTIDKVIVPTLDKMDKFIDENRSGIRTASVLDSKIITVFIGAIVAAGVYFLGKGGL